MGTLYIDRKELHVKLDGNTLAFYAAGAREGLAPLGPLKRVVVVGNITLDAAVLHRCAEENISVVFLSGKGNRFRGMLHGSLHNNGLLRLRQYEKASTEFARVFAAELTVAKTTAQEGLLKEALDRRADLRFPLTNALRSLETIKSGLKSAEVTMETLRGLEGAASAAYFRAYISLFPPSLNFTGRNRRPPEDPANAMLSLCYTMLHFEMVREIEVIGLDPTIGFYHCFDYGRESLACDLVEPFRPEIDRLVWRLFRDREFTDRDFVADDARPGCYLKKEGRKRFYPLYEEWAREMRPLFTANVRALAGRIMDEQNLVSA
jgi:CRISPR-associated protein Cas1